MYLHAHTIVESGKLHPDNASANDGDTFGEFFALKSLTAGPVFHGIQPGNGGDESLATGGEEEARSRIGFFSYLHTILLGSGGG